MKTTQSSQCIYFTIIIHNAKGSVSLSRLHFLYSHIIWQIAKTTWKMLFNGIKTLYVSFSTMIRVQTTLVPSVGFHSDIYTGWVAQELGADLLVESWQRQGHDLPSNCSLAKHTMNIKKIQLPRSILFYSHYDHSKWCVSRLYEDQVTCLGDLNREMGQLWRGGGLICSSNPLIYKAFRQVVDWYIQC